MKWISVKDRLPEGLNKYEEQKTYIVYLGNLHAVGTKVMPAEWLGDFFYNCGELVTHWMPLPEPPKEENNG